MLIAKNIQWDFDIDEVFERLDNMPADKAAEELGIPKEKYANMTTEERHNFAYDLFHHCPAALDEFMGLPDEIEIPRELIEDEDISNWLSDEYGFCHEGFELESIFPHKLPMKKITCPHCGKELINLKPDIITTPAYWCDDCNLGIEFYPDEETPVSIYGEFVRADWYNAGEGLCGDYNPEDPEDINLLRFDIYQVPINEEEGYDEEWEVVEDASYCTRMPADTDLKELTDTLYYIFKEYDNVLSSDPEASVKKLGEALSWVAPKGKPPVDKPFKEYYVHFHLKGRFTADLTLTPDANVENNIDYLLKKASEKFSEADFGEGCDIDGYAFAIEDEDGNYIWETD